MIEVRKGDIFFSNCDAITNAVNCIGQMGKGLAAEFKKRYYKMYLAYQAACQQGEVAPGKLHTWKAPDGPWIINFPTKTDWRAASEYSYIDQGLAALDGFVKANNIKSVALPALGCGLGGLKWRQVLTMIKRHHDLRYPDILLAVYEPHGEEKKDEWGTVTLENVDWMIPPANLTPEQRVEFEKDVQKTLLEIKKSKLSDR